jgi:hypothetical protein
MSDQHTCHICGAGLTEGKCLSCGHAQCPECPVYVPKPSYAELERQLAEERKLAEWTPITEQNLPKVGDEMGGTLQSGRWFCEHYMEGDPENFDKLLECGYTHRRPLNPPQPAPEGKKEGTV